MGKKLSKEEAPSLARGYKLLPGPRRYIAPGRAHLPGAATILYATLNAGAPIFSSLSPTAARFTHRALFTRQYKKKPCYRDRFRVINHALARVR